MNRKNLSKLLKSRIKKEKEYLNEVETITNFLYKNTGELIKNIEKFPKGYIFEKRDNYSYLISPTGKEFLIAYAILVIPYKFIKLHKESVLHSKEIVKKCTVLLNNKAKFNNHLRLVSNIDRHFKSLKEYLKEYNEGQFNEENNPVQFDVYRDILKGNLNSKLIDIIYK